MSPLILALGLALSAPGPDAGERPLHVTTDTSETPDLKEWADEARSLVEEWHPKAAALLSSDGFAPPRDVALTFKKDMKGVAHTSGDRITIAADWVRKHPEDRGMVVHELVHVIQSYPPSRDGWLVEGIADWVRFFKFEPKTKLTPPDPRRASYRDGYRTTAQFLDWVRATYDADLIVKLNAALRHKAYRAALFHEATGKNLDDLWAEYLRQAKGR